MSQSVSRAPLRSARDMLIAAAAVLLFDQSTKQWALANLQAGTIQTLVPGLIGLTLVTNTGTAFGMWRSQRLVGMLLPPLICLIIVAWVKHRETKGTPLQNLERIGFGMILGGAAGNMVDRFWRQKVTDFLYFIFCPSFPVFNVADALIDVGVLFILLQSQRMVKHDDTAAAIDQDNSNE